MQGFWIHAAAALLLAWTSLIAVWCIARRHDWLESADGWRGLPRRIGLALAVAATALGTLVVVMLARAWRDAPLVIDLRTAELARAAWSPEVDQLMRAVTLLGDPVLLAAVGVLVGLVLLWKRQPLLLVGWMLALSGNAWLNPSLKTAFARLRPVIDPDLAMAAGYSFPSGHSSGAMVCYGMLAHLAWRLAPLRMLLPVWLLAATIVLAVGASRLLLQVHYLSDVLAGFASAAAWLALVISACAAVRQARHN